MNTAVGHERASRPLARHPLACILLTGVAAVSLPAFAGIPPLMNAQGVLRTQSGAPVADGVHAMAFSLYGSAVDPSPLWVESHAGVAVSGGFYSAILGETTPLIQPLFQNAELWVGVRVDGGTELPRARILSVAYAFEAGRALIAAAAENVQCSSCIGKGALGFDLDATVDATARAACYDTPAELHAALDAVYAPLVHNHPGTEITSPVAEALLASDSQALGGKSLQQIEAEMLAAVETAGYLKAGDKLDPATMPSNSLDIVSNGSLSNKFDVEFPCVGVPSSIKDYWPTPASATVSVVEGGTILSVSVQVRISHPNASDLIVRLAAPNGSPFVLHDHAAGTSGGLDKSWPPESLVSGSLDALSGANPSGTWVFTVEDSIFSGGAGGTIESCSVRMKVLRTDQVALVGAGGRVELNGALAMIDARLQALESSRAAADLRFAEIESRLNRLASDGMVRELRLLRLINGLAVSAFDGSVSDVVATPGGFVGAIQDIVSLRHVVDHYELALKPFDSSAGSSLDPSKWTTANTQGCAPGYDDFNICHSTSSVSRSGADLEIRTVGKNAHGSWPYSWATASLTAENTAEIGELSWTANVVTSTTSSDTLQQYISISVGNIVITDWNGGTGATATYGDYSSGAWLLKRVGPTSWALSRNGTILRSIDLTPTTRRISISQDTRCNSGWDQYFCSVTHQLHSFTLNYSSNGFLQLKPLLPAAGSTKLQSIATFQTPSSTSMDFEYSRDGGASWQGQGLPLGNMSEITGTESLEIRVHLRSSDVFTTPQLSEFGFVTY